MFTHCSISIIRPFFLEPFIQSMMILDLQTGSIIETEQDIWFIYGYWPHPSSYEFFFKIVYVNNTLDSCHLPRKKTCSTNYLHCFQQVNIFPHPSYHSHLMCIINSLPFWLLFGNPVILLAIVYSSFPQLRGLAFICWIYYCDLMLFVGLAWGEKVAFNWEQ